jgi:hypothetical protein
MSGPNNKASQQATANENARQASIAGTQARVNQAYESPQREADIQGYMGATRDYLGRDLNLQKTTNDRELKFALARGGLTGGSTQVDQQKVGARDYTRGLLNVEQKTQSAGADLRSQDQDARTRLISLATSGLDATSAASMAASSMRSALDSSRSTAAAQGLGDMFGSASKYYQSTKDAQMRRQGDQRAFGLYAPSPSYGGGGGYGNGGGG